MSTREHNIEAIRSAFFQTLMTGPLGAIATDDHVPLSPPALFTIATALGWSGSGTMHDAIARIRDLRNNESRLVDRTRELKAAESELGMYANAWRRELGDELIGKNHLIDALVLTTEWMRERADNFKYAAAALGIKHEHYDRNDNAKLGVDVLIAIDAMKTELQQLRARSGIPE